MKKVKKKKDLIRELIIGITISAFAIVFIFIILEGAFRLIGVDYIPNAYNECTGFTLVPDSTAVMRRPEFSTKLLVNSDGFRDNEHDVAKKNETFRILLLGDSFVEGAQVELEDRYAQKLETILSKETGKEIEVITLAVSGFGTDQQYLAMNCYGLKYKPDLVILNFLTINDISDSVIELRNFECKPYFTLSENNTLILNDNFKNKCNGFQNKVKKFIGRNSQVFYFAVTNFQKLSLKKEVTSEELPLQFGIYKVNNSPEFEKGWDVVEKITVATKETAEKNGAKFMVVILSNPQQMAWNKTLELYPKLKTNEFALDAPNKKALQMCQRQNLPCLNLLNILYSYQQRTGKNLHFELDGHWNEIGNEQAAKAVASYIIQQKYISE